MTSEPPYTTEEDVKVKVVLPWLRARGIHQDDLRLEKSFTVRIGTQVVEVAPSQTTGKSLRPRLDILVQRRGLNLLIVETKAPGHKLSDADRDQAISYARLVHPIAPYALVTNGQDFRFYDSVTKEHIEPSASLFDQDRVPTVVSEEARREALRTFFGESDGRLLHYCQRCFEDQTRPLRGDIADAGATYIEPVNLRRRAIETLTRDFLQSNSPALVLLGESGIGKTCTSIDVADDLLRQGYPTFFVRGLMLRTGVVETIANEIGWALDSTGLPEPLQGASDKLARPLVVLVDGLEDWDHPARFQEFGHFLTRLAGGTARAILSCRSRHWRQFLERRGARSGLENHVFLATKDRPYSHELGAFSEEEFHSVLPRYRAAFGIHGGIERHALDQARRSPFLLRLLFQVAQAEKARHITLDSRSFFDGYFKLVADKCVKPDVATARLAAVADAMWREDSEWITESRLRELLSLGADWVIPEEFFDLRILEGDGLPGLRRVGFSFGQFRSYLIAFHVLGWPAKSPSEFQTDLASYSSKVLLPELVAFYHPFASTQQRAVVEGELRTNASAYLNKYESIINQHFPHIRDRFQPHTMGRIGFIAEFDVSNACLGFYGFRPVSGSEDDTLLVPVDERFANDRPSKTYYYNSSNLHYSSGVNGFRALDVTRQVVLHEIQPQLRTIIKKGRLNQAGALVTSQETLAAILLRNYKIFGKRSIDESGMTALGMLELIRRAELKSHFENELTQLRIENGQIKITRQGRFTSHTPGLTPADRELVEALVNAAILSSEEIPLSTRMVGYGEIRRRISQLIAEHGGDGSDFVPRLTGVALRPTNVADWKMVKERITEILITALAEYRAMVDGNFGSLTAHFSRLQMWPRTIVVRLETVGNPQEFGATLFWCDSDGTADAVIHEDSVAVDWTQREANLRTPHAVFRCRSEEHLYLRELLLGSDEGLEFPQVGSPVRCLVYRWLQRDWDSVERHLLPLLGLVN